MSEEIKKTGQHEEIADENLDTVAGGGIGDPVKSVGILGKKPNPGSITPTGGVQPPSPKTGGTNPL